MIKWAALQPLTGGMYIGAKNAIGDDAQFIISYPGTNDITKDKDGNIKLAGNEYNLLEWMKKNDCMVPYWHFSHEMFEDVDINEVKIQQLNGECVYDTPRDLDLVVAVPVCSGLSMVTSGSADTKSCRNNNMLFLAKYALNIIKPKIYVFENVPTLMSARGDEVRNKLEDIALSAGYSVLYYKTDTYLHHNCQKRPRTFVIFQKWSGNTPEKPVPFDYEDAQFNIEEYLKLIPDDVSQKYMFDMSPLNKCLLEFAKHKFGATWRDDSDKYLMNNVEKDWDGFIEFVVNTDVATEAQKDKVIAFVNHARFKREQGLNYMANCLVIPKEKTNAVQFKSINSMLHPTEDRLFNIRENLHLMGMPHDFELHGDIASNYMKIGQNVPVKTAEWIVKECLRVLPLLNESRDGSSNVSYIDNVKQAIVY